MRRAERRAFPRWWPVVGLMVAVGATSLGAQTPTQPGSVVEHRFEGGAADSIVVELRNRVVYWAEVVGPGTPSLRPVHRYHGAPLVVPHEDRESRRFEIHPGASDSYVVTLEGLLPGTPATLRIVLDEPATQRMAEQRERDLALGLMVGAGRHSAYRIDPTGGLDPRGGSDFEACIMVRTGSPIDGCLGVGRQTFPDADYDVTWLFVEPRVRLVSAHLFGGSLTDLTAAFRLAQAPETGPRTLDPVQLAFGVYVTQHLSGDGRRRDWSIYTAWHHGRLGNTPETEMLNVDRITAGLLWVP